jgi:hypothetical protein
MPNFSAIGLNVSASSAGQIPLYPLKKETGLNVDMLIRVNYVAVVPIDEFRGRRHQALLVLAGQK